MKQPSRTFASVCLALSATSFLALTGCERKSETERAVDDVGDKVEDAADNVGDAVEDATD